jgi:hypothetical protein
MHTPLHNMVIAAITVMKDIKIKMAGRYPILVKILQNLGVSVLFDIFFGGSAVACSCCIVVSSCVVVCPLLSSTPIVGLSFVTGSSPISVGTVVVNSMLAWLNSSAEIIILVAVVILSKIANLISLVLLLNSYFNYSANGSGFLFIFRFMICVLLVPFHETSYLPMFLCLFS